MLKIKYLDHVAIKVEDLERSAQWYEETLGLKRYQPKEWHPFPIMMLTENKSGIALFPVKDSSPQKIKKGENYIYASHFAFQVSAEDFDKAKTHFEENNIKYRFENYYYNHSLFIQDPDGYEVELMKNLDL